uniref:Sphingomyelin phosphodiesterase 4 n=1 Tax=Peronospora matthiolae TaxID=2874970 RepID=A0AAV1T9P0_9STRA
MPSGSVSAPAASSPSPASSVVTFSESTAEFERALHSYDITAVVEALHRYLASETQASLSAAKHQSMQLRSVFYERFNQLLDRIFGIDAVSKHKFGGWLDYSAGLGVAPSAGSAAALAVKKRVEQRQERALAGVATDEDDVEEFLVSLTASGRAMVKLLGGGVRAEDGSVFQFLFRVPHPVEFKFALELLPEQSKMAIVSGRGASLLFTQLLHKPLAKQRLDLRSPELLVSITELYLFYFFRHPVSSSHTSGGGPAPPATSASTASGILTSASSLSGAAKARQSSWRMYSKNGVAALTRGSPYSVLLLQYLRAFLPDTSRGVKSRFHGKLLKDSNLFLHILIEFWLRQNLISFSNEPVGASTAAPGVFRPPPSSNMLASPFAAVYTSTSYMAPSDDLLSSLLLAIIYLLSDSFFPAPLAGDATNRSQGGETGMIAGSGGAYLSRSVTLLRPPLYAFFRLVFSRASIGLSPRAFIAIVDVWLAYIQPWHCRSWMDSRDPTSPEPAGFSADGNTPTGYTPAWESYVLANYHFYTTLLGAFVERAKELDFSADNERNLEIVDRVMSMFNSDLLALLRRASLHLEKCQPFAIPFGQNHDVYRSRTHGESYSTSAKTKSTTDVSLTATQAHVLTFYCKSLGIECTPVPLHDSFHRDAERLFDKLWVAVATDASTTSSPADLYKNVSAVFRASDTKTVDGVAEQVQRLSRMLRRVFEISDAYVASTAHSRSSATSTGSSMESLAPNRDKKLPHLLSREGVFQLQHGMRLCSADTAQYIGDPMLRPICSYEVVWLVRLSYRVSTWLNAKFGFTNPYHGKRLEDNLEVDPASPFVYFRFNFRFLASKVNLSYLGVFLLLLYMIYFW